MQSECFEKKKWGEKGRCFQVGGIIIAPGEEEEEEEEETKLTFIDFESLCYVDVFKLFCWKFQSFTFVCFIIYLVLKVYIFFLP